MDGKAAPMPTVRLVAIVDLNDNANEDQWAQSLWHVEVAVREAAVKAGQAEDQLLISRPDGHTVIATADTGDSFAGLLRVRRGAPYLGTARQPTERDYLIWEGKPHLAAELKDPAGTEETPPDGKNIHTAWPRIEAHAGETFTTVRGTQFTYSAFSWYVTVQHLRRNIPRSAFFAALEAWPVNGPGQLPPMALPSYVYAVLNDRRIRGAEW